MHNTKPMCISFIPHSTNDKASDKYNEQKRFIHGVTGDLNPTLNSYLMISDKGIPHLKFQLFLLGDEEDELSSS